MESPNRSQFDLLTFDCYGTLIDWESGLFAVLKPVMSHHGVAITDDSLLELYARIESLVEEQEYRSYREVLSIVMRRLSIELEFRLEDSELNLLADSIKRWPPFSDSVDALQTFQKRFKLGIISNIDEELFEHSNELLHCKFDYIVTAKSAKAYKPSLEMFEHAFAQIDISRDRILHVAQSLYHDIVPCNQMDMKCVWVNRRKGEAGSGATPVATASPTWEVGSLAELVELFR